MLPSSMILSLNEYGFTEFAASIAQSNRGKLSAHVAADKLQTKRL